MSSRLTREVLQTLNIYRQRSPTTMPAAMRKNVAAIAARDFDVSKTRLRQSEIDAIEDHAVKAGLIAHE